MDAYRRPIAWSARRTAISRCPANGRPAWTSARVVRSPGLGWHPSEATRVGADAQRAVPLWHLARAAGPSGHRRRPHRPQPRPRRDARSGRSASGDNCARSHVDRLGVHSAGTGLRMSLRPARVERMFEPGSEARAGAAAGSGGAGKSRARYCGCDVRRALRGECRTGAGSAVPGASDIGWVSRIDWWQVCWWTTNEGPPGQPPSLAFVSRKARFQPGGSGLPASSRASEALTWASRCGHGDGLAMREEGLLSRHP